MTVRVLLSMVAQEHTVQRERVDVLTVVWPGHVFLAKTDGVFSLGNAVKLFEGSFRDALSESQ